MKLRLTFTNVTPITEIDIELPDCDELTDVLEAERNRIEKEERRDLHPFDAVRMLEGVLYEHLTEGMSVDFI